MLTLDDFPAFFDALNNDSTMLEAERRKPFPWQSELIETVQKSGWPDVLDLPTGSGKTSVLDIAVFHIALCAGERSAPRRIFFVVDRRVVVDAAFQQARRIANRLKDAEGGVLGQVADALRKYGGEKEEPLHAAILRGGMYRDDSWAASPVQPVICVSTVDQVGSRLLFRGYGLTPSMRPIHAGLVGCDSLILLDEAHLSASLEQTLKSVIRIRDQQSAGDLATLQPLQFVRMTATPREEKDLHVFRLSSSDENHPVLSKRLRARKLARLEDVKTTYVSQNMSAEERRRTEAENRSAIARAAVEYAWGFTSLESRGGSAKKKKAEDDAEPTPKVVGVVVNRVATAREIFQRLKSRQEEMIREREKETGKDDQDPPFHVILLTGRTRPFDRDELLYRERIPGVSGEGGWLRFMKAGRRAVEDSLHEKPLFVVATQTIEAGADLDFDALVTEIASLDALRQRFGRLNRLGHREVAHAVILARSQVRKEIDDPVYGAAIAATYEQLADWREDNVIDFGINNMDELLASLDEETRRSLIPETPLAPELSLEYVHTLCQTNPAPVPEPDVSLFLHGAGSGDRPADVQIVWRADLPLKLFEDDADWIVETVNLIPPSSPEVLAVSPNEARRWLASLDAPSWTANAWGDDLTDVEGTRAPEEIPPPGLHYVLRWCGPESENTQLIPPRAIRPGDTIVVPAAWGGCDRFGWNPPSRAPVDDIAERANLQARHRPVLRLHRSLLGHWISREQNPDQSLSLPESIDEWLSASGADALPRPSAADVLDSLSQWLQERNDSPSPIRWLRAMIECWTENRNYAVTRLQPLPRRADRSDLPGLLLQGKRRWKWDDVKSALAGGVKSDGEVATHHVVDLATTEDDTSWMIGERLALGLHTEHVMDKVAAYAAALEATVGGWLAPLLKFAAKHHDDGKRAYRFQVWMHGGKETAAAASDQILAKSGMTGRVAEAARQLSGWPKGHRHEGISVRLVESLLKKNPAALPQGVDSDLVLYLIGTHHGHGKPFFPVVEDSHPDAVRLDGPEAAASSDHRLHHISSRWCDLFWRVTRRYGAWNLAYLEALLRLADQAASAEEQENSKPGQSEKEQSA